MSVNRHLAHVYVLPEDDADRQLANGFQLGVDLTKQRQMQVLEEAGGWLEVLNRFESDHIAAMDRYANRHMVLLIDFDGKEERFGAATRRIPERLKGRVFVIGAWNDPEDLKRALSLRSLEEIGLALAQDCREGTDTIWEHELLRHNCGRACAFTGACTSDLVLTCCFSVNRKRSGGLSIT